MGKEGSGRHITKRERAFGSKDNSPEIGAVLELDRKDVVAKQEVPIATGAFDFSQMAEKDSTSGKDYVKTVATELLEHFKNSDMATIDAKDSANTSSSFKIITKNADSGLKIKTKESEKEPANLDGVEKHKKIGFKIESPNKDDNKKEPAFLKIIPKNPIIEEKSADLKITPRKLTIEKEPAVLKITEDLKVKK